MEKVERRHDSLYLIESRYDTPKEIFKLCVNLIGSYCYKSNMIISDFGCATGEFLYFINKTLPDAKLYGYELLPELIEKAKRYVDKANFKQGSVLNYDLALNNSTDIALLFGVLGIFDEFETTLNNLIAWTKPQGRIFCHALFNSSPVDVIIRYRYTKNYHEKVFETGFNIFAKDSISTFLGTNPKVKDFKFHPFIMSLDLDPQPQDPLRSWTFKDNNGHRLITNGLSIIQDQYILEIVVC
jgi:SAM-dependent methyltransferase